MGYMEVTRLEKGDKATNSQGTLMMGFTPPKKKTRHKTENPTREFAF